jgi:Lanthionine synthetase C-like protein
VSWDEARARRGIAAIVADAEGAFDGKGWPVHPPDEEVTPNEAVSLYLGAAGVIWALRRLGSGLQVAWPEAGPARDNPSLFVGESGMLLVSRADDAHLQQLIDVNADNPACEVLWGAPGTMVAARHAGLDAERSAELLLQRWDAATGLWTQDWDERERQLLGAVHGFAGNVHALRGWVDDDELRRRVESVLRAHAVWDGDTVNWPPQAGGEADRIQWCHGAPGIVATIGDLMPDDLLLGGAELTWRTGPLEKGPGLCHGTAGNGYALLRAYELTGDELWLERARTFAMHALGQLQQRYSLMTGDIGAALFVQSCIDADARFPIMDVV